MIETDTLSLLFFASRSEVDYNAPKYCLKISYNYPAIMSFRATEEREISPNRCLQPTIWEISRLSASK